MLEKPTETIAYAKQIENFEGALNYILSLAFTSTRKY